MGQGPTGTSLAAGTKRAKKPGLQIAPAKVAWRGSFLASGDAASFIVPTSFKLPNTSAFVPTLPARVRAPRALGADSGQKAWSANSSREGGVARKVSGKRRRCIVHRADVVQTSEHVGIRADAARTSARATSARRRFGAKSLVCK